ncbi:TcdA/TcdB catalytic glycosyltransferase domain-containing protein [Vibrio diabolicus]|uniref:TcdA/TcdB catalytic glycosyltransferase domain-containing protein n=1 Tax=Vibrio diabolicus TaxID=50719 RepID=UPI00216052DB|nr:TcdA/TcdB catalytic glycosyltransferase domain-containing protein [Vibrio diabolicus]MCS0418268.1 hypothetical protein [Vibrio diabolicus]
MVDLFKRAVCTFDKFIDEENYDLINEIICKENIKTRELSSLNMYEVPNSCHFIWLGNLNLNSLDYLSIWQKNTSSLTLWIDSQTQYSSLRNELLTLICNKNGCNLIKAQNILYQFATKNGISNLDKTLESYSQIYFPELVFKLQLEKEKYSHNLSILESKFEVKDIRGDFETIFFDDAFKKFYLYETILRGNFAAASDILRILILKLYGGVYIDVDTLPKLEYNSTLLQHTSQLTPSLLNLVDVVLSHAAASQLLGSNPKNEPQLDGCIELLNAHHPKVLSELEQVISKGLHFSMFKYPVVHRHLLSISASKNSLGEFNNNLIAAHPNSKALGIVLREMKKRYRHCETHGYIFEALSNTRMNDDDYYRRLQHYRYDGLKKGVDEEVTLILTGPSLLLEVMIGCAYQLCKLDNEANPSAISYAFKLRQFGLSYSEQTMFTLKHINSSWMNK